MTSSKAILILLILGAAAAGVFTLVSGDGGEPNFPATGQTQVARATDPEATSLQSTEPQPVEARPAQTPTRTEVPAAPAGRDHPQGVMGQVLTPQGAPAVGTKIFLMEASTTDLFQQLRLAHKGIRIPPLASTEADETGAFRLGVQRVDATKRYEVRIVSDDFVDHNVPPVAILENQWYDLKRITLARGATLWGRVTIEGSGGVPVPDAIVLVKPNNYFPSVNPTPGREEGIEIPVDHTGGFRIANAPSGVVNIAAVAPGYARIERQSVTIDEHVENQVMFELPAGVTLSGLVTDVDGLPVKGARLEATAMSAKSPTTGRTHSEPDGSFEVVGLTDGPYMLTAVAPGFVRAQIKPVQAPDASVQVVLERQGEAGVRAYDKNNRLMRSFNVTIKTYTENQELYGNTDIPTQTAKPDGSGIATITGLDPGSYVFQVEARGHCKTFSEPFTIAMGQPKPIVDVRLTEGGVIEGAVTDVRGQPVANVRVRTLPNHFEENPFTTMFKGIIPYKITQQSVNTDAQGRYRLALLTPGQYQLKFEHPRYYEVFSKNHEVADGSVTSVPAQSLETGTLLHGTVRVNGEPGSQVKITISSLPDTEGGAAPRMFSCDAMTDNDGKFAMPKRIPPGRYQVMAARQMLSNPLLTIADFHKTKQEITLPRGKEKHFLTFSITE